MRAVFCPNCDEKVPAEQVNIQQMAAVCPNCDAVFSFDVTDTQTNTQTKVKRRKVKKPYDMLLRDDYDLEMAFRTNWRLDRSAEMSNAVSILFITVFITFALLPITSTEATFPFIFPLMSITASGLAIYRLFLLLYNRTHIHMDDQQLTVTRKPIANPLHNPTTINLNGVVAIHCEETDISIERQYDTPRYRVWAEYADGHEKTIVVDVVDDYGFFIAQRLRERLFHEDAYDVSNLVAQDNEPDNLMHAHEQPTQSRQHMP